MQNYWKYRYDGKLELVDGRTEVGDEELSHERTGSSEEKNYPVSLCRKAFQRQRKDGERVSATLFELMESHVIRNLDMEEEQSKENETGQEEEDPRLQRSKTYPDGFQAIDDEESCVADKLII